MENLEKVGREIYEEGVSDGRRICLQKFLNKKLKEENGKINLLIETTSTDKLYEIENKIFDINSWSEVEEILK